MTGPPLLTARSRATGALGARLLPSLEEIGFEPSVPLANQHSNCQVGLGRYRCTGTGADVEPGHFLRA